MQAGLVGGEFDCGLILVDGLDMAFGFGVGLRLNAMHSPRLGIGL